MQVSVTISRWSSIVFPFSKIWFPFVSNRRDPRMMTDGDLWRVSASMNNINWRALGRTLGLQESALVNIESSYRTAGCRECAYQVLLEWKGLKPKQCTVGFLYSALTKENMNEVAKQIAANTFGDDES